MLLNKDKDVSFLSFCDKNPNYPILNKPLKVGVGVKADRPSHQFHNFVIIV